jgi:hypothetical protein
MVEIANPIYDVVFKYLMRDEKVAKLLLSAIIGKEVVSLEFRPTEHHFPVGELLTAISHLRPINHISSLFALPYL